MSDKSSRQIEREADQSRARIEGMLDQLQARLSPGQIMDQVQSYLKSGPGEFGSNLGAVIKRNPIPVALAGIGLGWLAIAGNREPSRPARGAEDFDSLRAADADELGPTSYADLPPRFPRAGSVYSDVSEDPLQNDKGLGLGAKAGAAGESAQRLTQDVGQRIGDAGEQVRRRASRAQDEAGRVAQQAKDGFMRFLTEQPLVVAGLGLALGALLGAALPSTEQEDDVMGEASDGLKRDAEAFGREQIETAQATVAEKVDQGGASEPKPSERSTEGAGAL